LKIQRDRLKRSRRLFQQEPKAFGESSEKGSRPKREEDGLVAPCLFPLSAEVRIGQVAVIQLFNIEEMQFRSNLEL
jgi:hypothetical protein